MQVGMQLLWQNYLGTETDQDMIKAELHMAELAEPLGFDSLWTVEHHFGDYSVCPNTLSFLNWMAGRTSTIKLGTAAVILPWHNPLRVAAEASMLDNLSEGRLLLGFGRGLARREYEKWQLDMNDARQYFNEAAKMIVQALETGVAEFDGEALKQVRAEIRPRPFKSFKDRIFCVAMSPDTVPVAAEIGAVMMMVSQIPWDQKIADITEYRQLFHQHHGRDPQPIITQDFAYCGSNAELARARMLDLAKKYYVTAIDHYEMNKSHFARTKGYQFYANAAQALEELGMEKIAEGFADLQASGTPEQILRKLEERRELIGDFQFRATFRFADIPLDEAEHSMRLFAKEVLPVLKSWSEPRATGVPQAAE